jgi:hypothetical protein
MKVTPINWLFSNVQRFVFSINQALCLSLSLGFFRGNEAQVKMRGAECRWPAHGVLHNRRLAKAIIAIRAACDVLALFV